MNYKKHIGFYIQYNWPPTKNSISGISTSPHNAKLKIRVLAENKDKPDERYTFTEIVKGFHSVYEVSKLLSEGASQGRYLTGDIFYIEVKNEKTGHIRGMKLNAFEKIPSHAKGPIHVSTQYFFEA